MCLPEMVDAKSDMFDIASGCCFFGKEGMSQREAARSLTWPLKSSLPNRKVKFQPPFFSG